MLGEHGKSTLSRKLKDKLPNYNLIHADAIRNGIINNLEEKYIENFLNYQENGFFQKVLLDFLDVQTSQDSSKYGTILEGVQILPKALSEYKNLDKTIVVYLGHGDLNEEEIFKFVREYDTETDWTYKKTDDELREEIKWFYEKNQFLLKECEKYGFKYVDTHENREQVLNEVFNYICEELKK